mmetsp:Transcript_18994/g.60490  ORF Transcript_18994/g.60490 Transcript_18994/m.60490 type:complete len:210 (+) Transcript_18994:585-1214(+)
MGRWPLLRPRWWQRLPLRLTTHCSLQTRPPRRHPRARTRRSRSNLRAHCRPRSTAGSRARRPVPGSWTGRTRTPDAPAAAVAPGSPASLLANPPAPRSRVAAADVVLGWSSRRTPRSAPQRAAATAQWPRCERRPKSPRWGGSRPSPAPTPTYAPASDSLALRTCARARPRPREEAQRPAFRLHFPPRPRQRARPAQTPPGVQSGRRDP